MKKFTYINTGQTRVDVFNFDQVEVLARECVEGPRKIIEVGIVCTKLRN